MSDIERKGGKKVKNFIDVLKGFFDNPGCQTLMKVEAPKTKSKKKVYEELEEFARTNESLPRKSTM